MKKRILSVLLALCVVAGILPAVTPTAQAANNPYGYWQTFTYNNKQYKTVTCTWFAWQQVHDNLGIDLPVFGDGYARSWLANAPQHNYQTGTEPRVGSIACWNDGGWGHVAYVTAVNGSSITYNEGGSADQHRQDTVNGIYYDHTLPDGYTRWPDGFIYLDNSAPSQPTAPAASDWSPTLNFGDDFFAYIKYAYDGSSPLYLKNDSINAVDYGNVSTGLIGGNMYNPRYIWHVVRKGDSYKIINEYDGRCLDVLHGKDENCTNIGMWESNDDTPQRWRFYKLPGNQGSTFCMMPDSSGSRTRVADICNGSTSPNGNLWVYEQNFTPAQNFAICKLSSNSITYSKPAKPGAPQNICTSTESGGKTKISWNQVPTAGKFDKREYEVVVDGVSYTTKSTSISLALSNGAHSVKVRAVNTSYLDYTSAYTSKTIWVITSRSYIITVKASLAEGGSVSGENTYSENSYATVSAVENYGYRFVEWRENGRFISSSPSYTFKVTASRDLTAVFEEIDETDFISGWIPEPQ